MITSGVKLSFGTALHQTGLQDEFVRLCRGGASQADVIAWVRSRPGLAAIAEIPKSFRRIRQRLDCSAPAGGRRPNCTGKRFYSVAGIK
jgi:hypothetical protein